MPNSVAVGTSLHQRSRRCLCLCGGSGCGYGGGGGSTAAAAVATKTPAETAMAGGKTTINNHFKAAAATPETAMLKATATTMKMKATAAGRQ
jgi:hypothetical protein